MMRGMWWAVFAAALTAGQSFAGDDAIPLGRYQPTNGGFSAGVPKSPATTSVAPLPTDDDTELVHWRRGFYGGGYRVGWAGGWGWGGGWGWNRGWGGWNAGWGRPAWGWGWGGPGFGYAGFYRPGFAVSFYSAPQVVFPSYYVAPSCYGFLPVAGGNAPTVNLYQPREVQPPNPRTDTFQYDGGPIRPLPNPAPSTAPDRGNPAPSRIEPAADGTFSIKLVRAQLATPLTKSAYKYPAYGEK